jgi:hypothetical protein
VLALLDGVVPVLDPHHLAEAAVRPAGDVAGRDDAGRGQAGRVAQHAVVQREARALEPARVRGHPDADDHDVGVDRRCRRPSTRRARPPSVAVDAIDPDAEADVDAVVAVQLGATWPISVPEDPTEGTGQRLDHGDVEAAPGRWPPPRRR